jgi:accessory gene regulator protein AgrB
MKYLYLIGGLVAFGLSFIIHHFYMQFIVLGIFLLVLFTIEKNSSDVAELKKVIEEHNELIKKDIEELKK